MAFSVVDTLRRFETHLTTIGSSLNANMSRVIVARNIQEFIRYRRGTGPENIQYEGFRRQDTEKTVVQSGAELSVSVHADGKFSIRDSDFSIANGVLIGWESNNGEEQSKDVIDIAKRLLDSTRKEFTINVLDPIQRVHITGRDSILYKDTDIWIGNIEKWL